MTTKNVLPSLKETDLEETLPPSRDNKLKENKKEIGPLKIYLDKFLGKGMSANVY